MPEEPGNKNDEQVAVRRADASGGYIMENQHEEKIIRDIQVSKRGSGAAREEQSDKCKKTERFEQEAPNASATSDPHAALAYPASGEIQSRPGTYIFLCWMHSTGRMDEGVVSSEKCWSGIEEKMPGISKELNSLRIRHVSMISRRKFANFF